MSVMSEETMLDAAAYAVGLLHRASAGETPPFTPGVQDVQIKSIEDCWGGPTWWGRWEKQMAGFLGGEKRR